MDMKAREAIMALFPEKDSTRRFSQILKQLKKEGITSKPATLAGWLEELTSDSTIGKLEGRRGGYRLLVDNSEAAILHHLSQLRAKYPLKPSVPTFQTHGITIAAIGLPDDESLIDEEGIYLRYLCQRVVRAYEALAFFKQTHEMRKAGLPAVMPWEVRREMLYEFIEVRCSDEVPKEILKLVDGEKQLLRQLGDYDEAWAKKAEGLPVSIQHVRSLLQVKEQLSAYKKELQRQGVEADKFGLEEAMDKLRAAYTKMRERADKPKGHFAERGYRSEDADEEEKWRLLVQVKIAENLRDLDELGLLALRIPAAVEESE